MAMTTQPTRESVAQMVRRDDAAGVARLVPEAPLSNPELWTALRAAVASACTDDRVQAMVLVLGARSGAGQLLALEGAPALTELADVIEKCDKPVVAAMSGLVADEALALAVAAHYRVMASDARLHARAVAQGLIPAGGLTQRLPRLSGAGAALDLLRDGATFDAPAADAAGLVDAVAGRGEDAATSAAIRFAHACIAEGVGPRRTRHRDDGMRDPAAFGQAIGAARAASGPVGLKAGARVVDCVEMAQFLPLGTGLAYEAEAAQECRASEDVTGLRHLISARSRLRAAVPRAANAPDHAAILLPAGAAVPDALVAALLGGGLHVTLIAPDVATLRAGFAAVAERQEAAVRSGAVTARRRDADWARLGAAHGAHELGAQGLVVVAEAALAEGETETLAELQADMPAQGAVAALLPAEARAGALAPLLDRAVRPATVMGLAADTAAPPRGFELMLTPRTADAAHGGFQALAGRLGCTAVPARGAFISGALLTALEGAVAHLIGAGTPPAHVAAVLDDWGLSEAAPATDAARGAEGPGPLREVRNRLLAALANAGAHLLADGTAARPGDIDLVAVDRLGFAAGRGGPMLLADRAGVMVLRAFLRRWADEAPALWAPAPPWDDLFRHARQLSELETG